MTTDLAILDLDGSGRWSTPWADHLTVFTSLDNFVEYSNAQTAHFIVCRPFQTDARAAFLSAVEGTASRGMDVTLVVLATKSSSCAADVVVDSAISIAGRAVEFDGMTLMNSPHRTLVVQSERGEDILRSRLADDRDTLLYELWAQTHLDFINWVSTPAVLDFEWAWWDARALPTWVTMRNDKPHWPPCAFRFDGTPLHLEPLSVVVRALAPNELPAMPTSGRPVGVNGLVVVFSGWILSMLISTLDSSSPLQSLVETVWSDATERSSSPLPHLVDLSCHEALHGLVGRSDGTNQSLTALRAVAMDGAALMDASVIERAETLFRFDQMNREFHEMYIGDNGLFRSDPLCATALRQALSAVTGLVNRPEESPWL